MNKVINTENRREIHNENACIIKTIYIVSRNSRDENFSFVKNITFGQQNITFGVIFGAIGFYRDAVSWVMKDSLKKVPRPVKLWHMPSVHR